MWTILTTAEASQGAMAVVQGGAGGGDRELRVVRPTRSTMEGGDLSTAVDRLSPNACGPHRRIHANERSSVGRGKRSEHLVRDVHSTHQHIGQ